MQRHLHLELQKGERMTAFADMQRVSAVLRRHDYEHPAGSKHWNLWWNCPGCGDPHAFDERWQFDGNYERPTFSPSFLTWLDGHPEATREPYISGMRCHSFVRDGQIEYQSDCTHALAGKTVPLPPWPEAPRRRKRA